METFDPFLFLDYASNIATSDHSEVALRTCVGRAYYALYLFTRERLLERGIITRQKLDKSPHGSVIDGLKRLNRTAGGKLGQLFDLRLQADYFLQPSRPHYANWQNNWQDASNIAQDLRPKIERI